MLYNILAIQLVRYFEDIQSIHNRIFAAEQSTPFRFVHFGYGRGGFIMTLNLSDLIKLIIAQS